MFTKLYSAAEAAAILGRHVQTVRAAARRLCLGQRVGRSRNLVLSESDISAIRAEIKPAGCPKFVHGNDLWRRKKNLK